MALFMRFDHTRNGDEGDITNPVGFVVDDGGRSDHFRGTTGDCVVRSIAIAAGIPYLEVYGTLKARMGKGKSPRDGVSPKLYKPYLADLGFAWTPTMHVGQGCTVHLNRNEMPDGRLLVRLSRHLTAMIDGVVHDTYDPRREGTRCVYGYWSK